MDSPASRPEEIRSNDLRAGDRTGLELGLMTSPAVGRAETRSGRVRCLLVPLGATEQHGPHLPLATDTIIATAWATAAAHEVDGAVVAPPLPYGSSGEHRGFPGTISIGRNALRLVVVELVRSVARFCDRVVLVSGHGGNAPVLGPTVEQLAAEGHSVSWVGPRWPPGTTTDAHGGQTETSLLLHLQPELVAPFADVSGNTSPLVDLMPTLVADGLAAVADNGVLGNPSGASAELGAELFGYLVKSLVDHLSSDP